MNLTLFGHLWNHCSTSFSKINRCFLPNCEKQKKMEIIFLGKARTVELFVDRAAGELEGQRSGAAVVNDMPVACQSRGVTEPQRERPASNPIARRSTRLVYTSRVENSILCTAKMLGGEAQPKSPQGTIWQAGDNFFAPRLSPRLAGRPRDNEQTNAGRRPRFSGGGAT